MNNISPVFAPNKIGVIHMIGIGGIGISGMAELLHNLGYKVQGSDIGENPNILRLKEIGIKIFVGHEASNIENAKIIVRSTAVKDSNIEVSAAKKKNIPIINRADMLAELVRMKSAVAVAGSHGKTTTTSLVANIFEAAGLEPTVINGGIINSKGTNAYLGSGDWLVVEADESDGTFIKLPATIGVITNIDPEHLEHYGSFEKLKDSFVEFIERLPFYGFAVACKDHETVSEIISNISDRKIISYGITSDDVNLKALNIRQNSDGSIFDIIFTDGISDNKRTIKDIHLPMPGIHNVSNSLAAIAIMLELGFKDELIMEGFKDFGGVKRRFTKTGNVNGFDIIDDYAHHPKEIAATLNTARSVADSRSGKVIAIAQPHRYSRLNDLFEDFSSCFEKADLVYISEVFAAGEQPIDGINSQELVENIKGRGKIAYNMPDIDLLPKEILSKAENGDLVVFMGAGSITKWANDLPKMLQKELA